MSLEESAEGRVGLSDRAEGRNMKQGKGGLNFDGEGDADNGV